MIKTLNSYFNINPSKTSRNWQNSHTLIQIEMTNRLPNLLGMFSTLQIPEKMSSWRILAMALQMCENPFLEIKYPNF